MVACPLVGNVDLLSAIRPLQPVTAPPAISLASSQGERRRPPRSRSLVIEHLPLGEAGVDTKVGSGGMDRQLAVCAGPTHGGASCQRSR